MDIGKLWECVTDLDCLGKHLEFAYLERYPILAGTILIFFGPLAMGIFPRIAPVLQRRLLANVLLVSSWRQMASLVAISFLASTLVCLLHGAIEFDTPFRIEKESMARLLAVQETGPVKVTYWAWSEWKTAFWLLMGCSLPFWAAVRSLSTNTVISTKSSEPLTPTNAQLLDVIGGTLLGLVIFCGVMATCYYATRVSPGSALHIPDWMPFDRWVRTAPAGESSALRWIADNCFLFLGRGFAEQIEHKGVKTTYLAPGIWQLTVVGLLLSVLYFSIFLLSSEWSERRRASGPIPVAFYLVLIVTLCSAWGSAASYFLDAYRIPEWLIIGVVIFVLAQCPSNFWSDNRFRVLPTENQGKNASDKLDEIGLHDFFRARCGQILPTPGKPKTLVIVTAIGGGIHAAAWTSRVLTGLHRRYGNEFAQSLAIVSAVSGGSMGAMLYGVWFEELVAARRKTDSTDFDQICRVINSNARASSLESAAWSLAFPEMFRLAIPVINFSDRGEQVELRWEQLLDGSGTEAEEKLRLPPERRRLSYWIERARSGSMPAFIFNSTEVETGRRVLFSPVVAPRRASVQATIGGLPHVAPKDFLYKARFRHDINLCTAARMSAAFPFVAPNARPDHDGVKLGHLADGGYIDNEGIVSALDWLDMALHPEAADKDHYEREETAAENFGQVAPTDVGREHQSPLDGIDRVLILRIRHIHPDRANDPSAEKDQGARTKPELAPVGYSGPMLTVLAVQGTSQVERGEMEADLLKNHVSDGHPRLRIDSQWIDFELPDNQGEFPFEVAPLSWKLSPEEFRRYDAAWDSIARRTDKNDVFNKLDKYFANVEYGEIAAVDADRGQGV